jgi:hypothetical protein
MKSIMAALVARIRGDPELMQLLEATPQAPKVYPHRPPSAAVYPCITYYLLTGLPHEEITAEEDQTYSIDVWSKSFTLSQQIGERLDAVLRGAPLAPAARQVYHCDREFAADLAEELADGSTLYHKVTRWRVESLATPVVPAEEDDGKQEEGITDGE